MTAFTVIIPARNEASVLERTIAALVRDVEWSKTELIVVCNGCTDDTAVVARRVAPNATVLELGPVGKCGAINAGLERARYDTVLIVDADAPIACAGLTALAAELESGRADAVSSAPLFDTSRSSPLVRAYYRVYATHPYLTQGVGGSGVYGFSRTARANLAPFPPILGDDAYVRARTPASRQARVTHDGEGRPFYSHVTAPATLRSLLKLEQRWRHGDTQLRRIVPNDGPLTRLPRGAVFVDSVAYLLIKMLGRALALLPHRTWYQDRSSRQEVSADLKSGTCIQVDPTSNAAR